LNQLKEINDEFTTVSSVITVVCKKRSGEKSFYPPDPTEWSCPSAARLPPTLPGARSFKYGATKLRQRLSVCLPSSDFKVKTRSEIFKQRIR